jgi:hypothetical protein
MTGFCPISKQQVEEVGVGPTIGDALTDLMVHMADVLCNPEVHTAMQALDKE